MTRRGGPATGRPQGRLGKARRFRWLATAAISLAIAVLTIAPAAAQATFHLMSIREVYPGSAEAPGAEYVELQMYASGQNFVAGHPIRTYDAAGALVKANLFPADVASGANQSTIVMASPQAEAQFGIAADVPLSPSGQLDPAGGAVCFEAIDCVAWGAFGGSLPSPAGSPAAPGGIPDGMALRRTIAPNCATLLEAADDRDSGALDFAAAFPAPRPNSVAPSERACSAPALGGSGSPDPDSARRVPQTRIVRRPRRVTGDRTPTFRFASSVPRSTFLCKLDRDRFRRCRSPFTTRRLSLGPHVLKVRARAPGGIFDPSPARFRFRVAKRPHRR